MSTRRVEQGDPQPTHHCVWKEIAPSTYAVKVNYTNDAGEQLYAVFAHGLATGEHLTLPQVIERAGN